VDCDAGVTEFVHPPDKSRIGNTQISRQLLAGDCDHRVLHEGVEKLVEFSVHRLFGGDAQVNVDRRNGVCECADRNVVDTGLCEVSYIIQYDPA
jgi:hypothetical protein